MHRDGRLAVALLIGAAAPPRDVVHRGVGEVVGKLVARLAGVPEAVIEKARSILASFESGEGVAGMSDHAQLALFSNVPQHTADLPTAESTELVERIAAIDAETLSPLEALNLLADLVQRAKAAS